LCACRIIRQAPRHKGYEMNATDLVLLAGLGVGAIVLWLVTIREWRHDGRDTDVSGGRTDRKRIVRAAIDRNQLVLSLFVTDALLWYGAQTIGDARSVPAAVAVAADRVSVVAFIALVPLLFLWYSTRRFGWPSFLVPPSQRGQNSRSKDLTEEAPAAMKSGFLTFVLSVAVFVFILSVLWLLGIDESVRFWGLLTALLSGAVFVWGVRASRRVN
jgi:hypothetical protein